MPETDIDTHDDVYWGAKVRIATQNYNDVDMAMLSVSASQCLIGLSARANSTRSSLLFYDATLDGKPVGDWEIIVRKKRPRKP